MYRLNDIKKNVLILSFATLLAGCGGGETTTSTDSTTTDLTTTYTSKVVTVQSSEHMITADSATIDWTPYGYTTKLVEYGTSKKYGSEVLVQEEGTVTLYNLQANTEYHYRIVSIDENGRPVVSRDNTFITLPKSTQPIVTEPAPSEPTPESVPVETNNPPEAQNVMIVGTPKVGETLTVDYTFMDIDGDSEGDSIIAWSTPTAELQRGTSKTFTIPAELAGEKISAWVHPSDGTVVNAQGIQATDGYILIEAATQIIEPIVTEPAPTEPIVTEPIVTDPIVEETQTVCIEGNAKIEGHVTDRDTGAGLIDVQVNIGGCVTTTDSQGDYTLMNIAVNDKAVVTFSAEGYYKNSTIIQITDLSPNYTAVEIDKYMSQWTYDSQTLVSGAHVVIPAGVYINHDGSPYIGQVTAGLSYRNSVEKGSEIVFPGEYKGEDNYGNIVPFISYGFTVIDLTDESGNTLSVSDDITLIFEATGATAESIPLWFYDYEKGTWIEEGYATRQPDGTYEGTVSHSGTWSLNQPIEDASGIYTDRILYPDGTPVKNLRVHAIGDNWISTDLSTDENGVFEIEVIPGQAFTLSAYHYDDKYGAAYNGLISAVASGDRVDNSSL